MSLTAASASSGWLQKVELVLPLSFPCRGPSGAPFFSHDGGRRPQGESPPKSLADPTGRSAYFLSAGLASPFGPAPAFFAGAAVFASFFGVQNSGSRATNSFEG